MSFGLLAVRLLYRFYVRVQLSKWFTFSLFLVVCLLLHGRSLRLQVTYIYAKQTFAYPPKIAQLGGRFYFVYYS